MNEVYLLLSPRIKKLRNRLKGTEREKIRIPFILALISALWLVVFLIFVKALVYFSAEEMFGTIAAAKLLSMIISTFTFVVIISNIIAVFSTFYLAGDLELILRSPIAPSSVYTARFLETLTNSSWMVLVFGFPVFLAYGYVFHAPPTFYVLSFIGFGAILVMTTAVSVLLVQTLVRLFPVRRLRDLFVFIGILVFIGLYLLFRMLRPEEMLNPEGFASVMDYLSIMSEASSPWLPTTWLTNSLRPYITGYGFPELLLNFGVLVVAAIVLFRLVGHCHEKYHFVGYSRSVESRGARLSKSRLIGLLNRLLDRLFDPPTARLVFKEFLLMSRDWGRLSQLLLLLALIIVYLYNFSVLPQLDSAEANLFLKNFIAFLNIGLAGFVISSLGVRFLFPAVSAEGRAFWILKGSPVSLQRVLWVKYFFYLTPMLLLGLFLVIMTNRLLGLGFFVSAVSTVSIFFITLAVTSLSIGLGVLYADLKESDPSAVFSGFGGLMTMLYSGLTVAGIIILEAFPVYRIVTASYFGRPLNRIDLFIITTLIMCSLGLALFAAIYPLKLGLKRIMDLQI